MARESCASQDRQPGGYSHIRLGPAQVSVLRNANKQGNGSQRLCTQSLELDRSGCANCQIA